MLKSTLWHLVFSLLSGFIIPHSLVLVSPQTKEFPKFLFINSHSLQGPSEHRCACTQHFYHCKSGECQRCNFHLVPSTTARIWVRQDNAAPWTQGDPCICSTRLEASRSTWQARHHAQDAIFTCPQNIKATSLKDHFKTETDHLIADIKLRQKSGDITLLWSKKPKGYSILLQHTPSWVYVCQFKCICNASVLF